MAKYTIELRRVCDIYGRNTVEQWFKDYDIKNYLTPKQIEQIEKFDVWSKDRLAEKIVDHYYMREIGFETPALFKHYAKVTMQEIMERQFPKIYSKFLEFDPLVNVDFTETYTREIEGSSEGNSNSNSKNNASGLNINNDTPQTRITKQDLSSGAYASQVSQSDTETEIQDETNAQSSSSSNEQFTRHQKGNSGSITTAQKLIQDYRDIIIAIDEEIINELSKLFMGIY